MMRVELLRPGDLVTEEAIDRLVSTTELPKPVYCGVSYQEKGTTPPLAGWIRKVAKERGCFVGYVELTDEGKNHMDELDKSWVPMGASYDPKRQARNSSRTKRK